MNEICRLCLTMPNEKMCKLKEYSDIFSKVLTSMSIQIIINQSLPNKVCKDCTRKVNETYEFHKEITNNEKKLLNFIKNDKELNNFHHELNKIEQFNEDNNLQSADNNCNGYESDSKDYKLSEDSDCCSQDSVASKKIMNNVKAQIDYKNNVALSKSQEKENKQNETNENSEEHKNIRDEKEYVQIKKWNCLTCFEYCDSQADLIKHYELLHNKLDNKDYGIENIDSKRAESNNFNIDLNVTPALESNDTGNNSEKTSNKYVRPYVCKLCGRTYKTVYEIVRHSRAHNGRRFYCTFQCGFNTAYKAALKAHEKRRHGKLNHKYTCEKCGKGFPVRTWYDQHQNIHNNIKPFICDFCGVAFHMHRYLTAHLSTVHPQTSSVKRYKCVECLLPCDSKKSLTLHMEEHGIKTNLLCDMCGKVFSTVEQMKYHKNVHLGVKPYSCSICSKKFTKKFNMKQHELTHTGERSHACNVCGKFYTQRSALLRHNKSHHSE